jgi:hypothetical protein
LAILTPSETTPKERTTPWSQTKDREQPQMATAAGPTGDDCCHWYVNPGRTLCGISHPRLKPDMFHRQAPCPNGNQPCPECVSEFNR